MKKILVFTIIASLVLSMAACSNQNATNPTDNIVDTKPSTSTQEPNTETVPTNPEETSPSEDAGVQFVKFESVPMPNVTSEKVDLFDGSQSTIYTTGLGSVDELAKKASEFRMGDKYTDVSVSYETTDSRYPYLDDERAEYLATVSFVSSEENGPTYDFIKLVITNDYSDYNDSCSVRIQVYNSDQVTDEQYKFAAALAESCLVDIGKYMSLGYTNEDNIENISETVDVDENLEYHVSRKISDGECLLSVYFESNANPYGSRSRTCRNLLALDTKIEDVFKNITVTDINDADLNTTLSAIQNIIPGGHDAYVASIIKSKYDNHESYGVSINVPTTDDSEFKVSLSYRVGDSSETAATPAIRVFISNDNTDMSREEFTQLYKDVCALVAPEMEITYQGTHSLKTDWAVYSVKCSFLDYDFEDKINIKPAYDGWEVVAG